MSGTSRVHFSLGASSFSVSLTSILSPSKDAVYIPKALFLQAVTLRQAQGDYRLKVTRLRIKFAPELKYTPRLAPWLDKP